MAIARTAPPAVFSSNSDATTYTTAVSFTPADGELVLVAVFNGKGTAADLPSAPTFSGGGLALASVTSVPYAASNVRRATLFQGIASGAGSGTITVGFGGNTQTMCVITITRITGTSQASPIVQSKTNTAGAGSTSLVVTLDTAIGSVDNAVLGFFGNSNNGSTYTAGSGFTQDQQGGASDGLRAFVEYLIPGTDTTVDCTLSSGATIGGIAVELAAASSGTVIHPRMTGGMQELVGRMVG